MSVLRTPPQPRDPATLSRQAAARRDEILEIALEIFSRKGFHNATIADIAKRASASRATVYQYFRDKADILTAIGLRVEQRILDAVNAWAPLPRISRDEVQIDPDELVARLRETIDTRLTQVLAMLAANADATRLMLRLIRGNDGLLEGAVRRIDRHIIGILANDIRVAVANGWARPTNAELTARYLLGGIEKILMDVLEPEEALELDVPAAVKALGALVFFGLVHPDLLARAIDAIPTTPDVPPATTAVPRLLLDEDDGSDEEPATPRTPSDPSARRANPSPTDPAHRGPSGRAGRM